ncbi:MAG: hypothetical protein KDE48_20835 [Anaerolineales bacterium]|nr:hypothetical protein [Anaerolineales bacterium]
MTTKLWLKFKLLSEACFSRGDGVPGVVDIEVNHDRYGMPYLGGRTLKGLLHAEAAEILNALSRVDQATADQWAKATNRLFGQPGSRRDKQGRLHIGNAQLPADLRSQIQHNYQLLDLHPHEVLETLTTVRRQTAVDSNPDSETAGAPLEDTLRAVRVIVQGTPFVAVLQLRGENESNKHQDDLALLAACTKAFRRAGSNKTRGYGRLEANLHETLEGEAVTDDYFDRFKESLQ